MPLAKWINALAMAVVAACFAVPAQAQQFLRIGTAGVAGTYYPVGSMIAEAVSEPGALLVTALATNGVEANIDGILGGSLEIGFAQSDVAAWAYNGSGIFQGARPKKSLRLIATLYPESVHLVARARAGIRSVNDLRGKRVALGEPGSGTVADARLILGAYGLSDNDMRSEYLPLGQAVGRLRNGSLDAFFFVGGTPVPVIADLAGSDARIDLVPLDGPEIDGLRREQPFFAEDVIPAGIYPGLGDIPTLAVRAQLIASEDLPEALVHDFTARLFSDKARARLDAGHAKGRLITTRNAVGSAGIPFHAGAEKFYREQGLIK